MCCTSERPPGLAEQVLLAISDANTGRACVCARGVARVGVQGPPGYRSSHCAHSVFSVSRVAHAPHCIKLIHDTPCRAAHGCQDYVGMSGHCTVDIGSRCCIIKRGGNCIPLSSAKSPQCFSSSCGTLANFMSAHLHGLIPHVPGSSLLLLYICMVQVGKGYAGRANKATTKAEAAAICEEGFASVEKLYL